MHQSGGSGSRKNDLRCATVRQRGAAPFAFDTNSWVVGKICHSRAVRSQDAVTIWVPSGLNAALETEPSWPLSMLIGLPVAASHSRAVMSDKALTMRRPSGLNAAVEMW